jgi:hypothetical protein
LPPRLIVTRWLWLLCSFQGPPRGRWAGRSARRPTDGDRSLKTQQHAPASELGDMPRDARGATAARRCEAALGPARFGRRSSCAAGGRAVAIAATKATIRRTAPCRAGPEGLPRKEVIQPHLPVRLPCYDFTPVTSPTFDGSLPEGLGHRLRVLLTPVV